MSGIIFSIVLTLVLTAVHALTLQLYVSSKRPFEVNSFGRALKVSSGISLGSWALGFIPYVGWLLGPVVWFLAVMNVYKLNFKQSVGLFFIQLGVSLVTSLFALLAWWMLF